MKGPAMLKPLLQRITAGSDVRFRVACTFVVLATSAVFLFANLGVYALWDDEAETALLARGVLATGDTTAVVGHNLNARRGGINLIRLADRLTPPLPTYLMAASFAIGGETALWARLPLAVCGLGAVAIMLALLWRAQSTNWNFVIFSIALLANVPFFLYCRNARYYGAVLLAAAAAGFLYIDGLGSNLRRATFSILGAALLFCHPMAFMQAAAVMAVDWFFFQSKKMPSAAAVAALVLPFLVLAVPGLCIWNPLFVKSSSSYLEQITISDRLVLLWWNMRDLFTAEFIPLAALVYAPLAIYLTRDLWIVRYCVAIIGVSLVTTATTHQLVSLTNAADVRYMTAAIPLGVAVGVRSFGAVPTPYRPVGMAVAIILFATSIGTGKFNFQEGPDSTLAKFVHELMHPINEPYTPVVDWLRTNAAPGASVLVIPEFMMYPLMFHAPNLVYAWQIADAQDPQFTALDPIHFQGRVPPDYVIAFGPIRPAIEQAMTKWRASGVRYDRVAELPVFWKDVYRPEVFWRTFSSIVQFDESVEGIFIYARIGTDR